MPKFPTVQFSSFSHSVMSDSATPWTAAYQSSLSITNSWNLLKFMSIQWVMPSNHLILYCPLLLLPLIFPSIKVFSNESVLHVRWPKYCRFILMAESEEELKSLLMKVKESEKAGLKLNIQKTKIVASGPITSWQINGEKMATVADYFPGLTKSLQMVTAAMKLKDACFLEEKL